MFEVTTLHTNGTYTVTRVESKGKRGTNVRSILEGLGYTVHNNWVSNNAGRGWGEEGVGVTPEGCWVFVKKLV